jgi:ribonuclease D
MIDTPQALAALVARALTKTCVALDTEFVWNRTYYPRLGVIQLALASDDCHLIDTVAIEDLSPLGPLLEHPEIELILHDAIQDLTILRQVTGAFPRNIFDTRCAAGLANMSSTTSLAELLENTLGVVLDKTETRTDWVRRPLSDEQLAYAIEDVCYMHEVREVLRQRVEEVGRSVWLAEELAAYDDPALYAERDPRELFLRVKGTGRASPRERAILRELAAWREGEARRRDRPRGHILSDETLILLSRRKPQALEDLAQVRSINVQRDGTRILDQIRLGQEVPDDECPRRPRRRRFDEDVIESKLAESMDRLRQQSVEAQIDAPFVAARAEVRSLVLDAAEATPEEHRLLRGWRREFVGADLHGIALRAE